MANLNFITVFINSAMYDRFFTFNSIVNGHKLIAIDNRPSNRGLPVIYNEIISRSINDDCWLFFVHEDFEILGGLESIEFLKEDVIYGTFGLNFENNLPTPYGRHICSNKDGSRAVDVGAVVAKEVSVQTLDCQSILIHSSLLRKHLALRFDENLTFDLYVEDLCLNAQLNYNIKIKVFPLKFQHYSHGNITERYHAGIKYLAQKYPNSAVAGSCSFIGGRSHELEKFFVYGVGVVHNSDAAPVQSKKIFREIFTYLKRMIK